MVRGWIAVVLWPCLSCLVGPPISGPPVVLDTPPSIADVEPAPETTVTIARDLTPTRSFQVGRVSGLDREDTIDYQFSVIAGEATLGVQRGTLAVDETRSTAELEVYQRIEFELDACSEELKSLDQVRVSLELSDPIPFDQVETLQATEHVVTVSWLVALSGDPVTDCPEVP